MYTLYYTTRSYTSESTSLLPRIALEEIGAPYEIVEVELLPSPPAWYLAINPHGKIPSLEIKGASGEGSVVVYPSAAILFHLGENHPDSGLLPGSAREKSVCFRRMFDMAEMLQSAYMMYFYPRRFTADEELAGRVRAKAVEWLAIYWARIEDDLASGRYSNGEEFTICDIYLYVMARWYVDVHQRIGGEGLAPFEQFAAASAHSARVESRKSVSRALELDAIAPITAKAD